MGFSKAGLFKISKSGKSLTVVYLDPFSIFQSKMYLNVKDVEKVLRKEAVQGDVFILEPEENNESCESHIS